MPVLTDYRADVVNLLATAVDASTWTTDLLDGALRSALHDLDALLVYETDVTVATAGYEQSLAAITDLLAVLSLAFPWVDDGEWLVLQPQWRFIAPATVRFENVKPAAGEKIRVRYSKQHKIQNLDAAAATTVSDLHRGLVGLLAAGWACEMRYRQISENPAIPVQAGAHVWTAAGRFRDRAGEGMSRLAPIGRLKWGSVGVDV
jgi:hypothetical protein